MLDFWSVYCAIFFFQRQITSDGVARFRQERHKKLLAETLLVDPRKYATNKNSSYLVEKLLSYCGLNLGMGVLKKRRKLQQAFFFWFLLQGLNFE